MITHDYELIFVHIPKCAGRSISEIFNQRFDQYTAQYYYMEYDRFFHSYRKFSIVRNPYARLVSMYSYIQQHRRHKLEPIACNGAGFTEWVINNFMAYKWGFDYDSPEAERGTDYMLGSPHWFSPQTRFLTWGDKMGYGFTIFNLEAGFDSINKFLRDCGVTKEVPHLNKSKHMNWQNYYTPELLRFLKETEFIKSDCEAFKYYVL